MSEDGLLPYVVEVPPSIAEAIIAVKKQIRQLGVDDKNPHGGYNYVSVDKFYERIGPMMASAGLALLIDEVAADVKASERADDRGNVKTVAWLFCRYAMRFMHESGATSAPLMRSCALPINGPQAFGAAQSYIEKQFLRQVFKVPTGDKDADATAEDQSPPNTGRPPAQKIEPARYTVVDQAGEPQAYDDPAFATDVAVASLKLIESQEALDRFMDANDTFFQMLSDDLYKQASQAFKAAARRIRSVE